MTKEGYIYRGSKLDPFYHSTDEWKTLIQWRRLGFVPKQHIVLSAFVACGEMDRLYRTETLFCGTHHSFYPTRIIIGYSSSACRMQVVRIHKSFMRKLQKCPTKR